MKYIVTMTLLVILSITMGDCGIHPEEGNLPEPEAFKTMEPEVITGNDDLQIDEINIQTEHCIAGNSQYAFYTELEMIPQTESAKSIKIYAYDYDSQNRKILYEWNNDNGFWLNELKATDTCLYWVLLNDGETFIQQYQLENREIRTIYSYKEGLPIVLTAGKDGIFWYDYYEKEEKISLKWYLEKDNEIHCLEDPFYNNSIYDRPSVAGDILTYARKSDGQSEIVRYDFNIEKEIDVVCFGDEVTIAALCGNQEYAVWIDNPIGSADGMEGRICIYDYEKKNVRRIAFPQEKESIFSFNLMGDDVLLNVTGEGLYAYRLDEDKILELDYERFSNALIPTVIQEKYFLAENCEEGYQSSKLIKIMGKENMDK